MRVIRVLALLFLAACGFCLIMTFVSCFGGTESRDDSMVYLIGAAICGAIGLFFCWLYGRLDD